MSRLTLAEAASRLKLSTRTVRRKIKNGSIHATFEDGKYYLDSQEVDRVAALSSKVDRQEGEKSLALSKRLSTPTTAITLAREEYDSLISRLGYLEGQRQLLLEDQAAKEKLAKELNQAQARIEELEAELDRIKQPWWRRLLKKR